MSNVIDYGVRKDRKTYLIHAGCSNCAMTVTVRLAFGQPKWETHILDRGPECPRCGCRKLTPGSIVGVEA